MTERFVCLNGKMVPEREARLSPTDRGFLYGDGLYETVRVRHGRAVRIALHAARLGEGARFLQIDLKGFDLAETVRAVADVNGLADARVRVTVTRGEQSRFPQARPTVVAVAEPMQDASPEPVRTVVSSCRRDEKSPLVRVKTTNCLASVLSLLEAREAGADDAILLNNEGRVAEAATSNVFVIRGSELITPPPVEGCLPGTVRAAVLDLAADLGLCAREVPVGVEELKNADEVFLTSAIRLARPVCSVDGLEIGTGSFDACLAIRRALLELEESESI